MATKTQIKKFLKENKLTEADMDKFWEELIPINSLVARLNSTGLSWKDMNTSVLEDIPKRKQKDVERIKNKEKEDEEKRAKELKAKQDEEYYEEHFEEVMIKKIENKEKLTERELSRVADYEVEREEGENRRWSQTITSYVQLKNRFFIVEWEQGLTEMQDNEFWEQPYEVEKKTYEKVIPEHKETVTEWVSK